MIDLHIHSNYSDGAVIVESLVEKAIDNKVKFISLTDHDTCIGLPSFVYHAKKANINVISGIEISSDYHGKVIHILGYGIDYNNKDLIDTTRFLSESRRIRAENTIEIANTYGFTLSMQSFINVAGNKASNIGKPHVAKALLINNKKLVSELVKGTPDFRNALSLMDKGNIFYIPKKQILYSTAIEIIHKSGGIAILAHPNYHMDTETDSFNCMYDLINAGIDGFEAFFGKSDSRFSEAIVKIATETKLFITAGSDFHGTDEREIGNINYYGMSMKELLFDFITTIF